MSRVTLTLVSVLWLGAVCSCDGLYLEPPRDGDSNIRDAFRASSEQPAWSPDGSTIVFTYNARTLDELALGANQLWLYSLESEEVTYLTEGHYATWSPAGDELAYTLASTLWTLDVASGEKRQVTSFGLVFQPRWSPTSQAILFVRWAPSQGLWTIDADGENLREVGIGAFGADWSPDGATLVCVSPSSDQLLKKPLLGNPAATLVDCAPALCAYPRWAPDGRWIAYHRYSGGLPSGLWFVGADGTDAREVIPRARRSSWSPDGTHLVYERWSQISDEYSLWVYSTATGTSRPLFGE